MLESILAGAVLGFLSGLGTGGGSLLILWLTIAKSVPQAVARQINLMFFVPSALIACLFRWKQGSLKIQKILPAIVAGSISAGLLAWFTGYWDSELLKKAFGILLLFTGIQELRYKPRK